MSDRLQWSLRVADADYVHAEPRTYRIYETPSELTLEFTILGGISSPVVVSPAVVQRGVTLTMTAGGDVPVVAEWSAEVSQTGAIRAPVLPETPIVIDAERGAGWAITLRRADDEPFVPGRYTIRVSLDLSAARTPEGQAWRGRLLFASNEIYVVPGPPADAPQERSAALNQRGQKALRQGRPKEALDAFQAAVAADPGSRAALVYVGTTCILLGRFREAIAPLEQALAMKLELYARSYLPQTLAHAYVGSGDEANAVRVLRAAGYDSKYIAGEIARLRSAIARRRR